jgi:drug/metabolite transporter (DMT)-like permease
MVFVNTMWGLSFILSKHALNVGFSPMTLAFMRYVVAVLVLVPAVFLKEKKMRLQKRDILPVLASGLLGITLYYLFEYQGIKLTTTVNASLILAAIPVLTLITDALAMKQRLLPRQGLGCLLSLLGVWLVVRFGGTEGQASIVGDVLVMGASLTWVGYIFVSRNLRARYSSLAMNAWQGLAGLLTLLPLSLMEKGSWQPVPVSGWLCVVGLGLVCSALCYFLYGDALKHLSPVASAIFINLIPVVTILGGVAFLNERVTLMQLAGGLVIVLSIFLVNLPSKETAKEIVAEK